MVRRVEACESQALLYITAIPLSVCLQIVHTRTHSDCAYTDTVLSMH